MAAHRLFCNIQTLSEVIRLRKDKPYSAVYAIIEKLSDLYLETIDKAQIKKLALVNPIIKKLLKRDNRRLYSINSIKEEIKSYRPDDIFLISPPDFTQFEDYRDSRGVLVINSLSDLNYLENISNSHFRPFNLLTEKQKQKLRNQNEEFEDINNWNDVFNTLRIEPINSAVIVDNYLLDKFERRSESLYNLIKAIVPEGLVIPFHLTIFVYNKNGNLNLKQDKLNQVIEEIHKLRLGSKVKVSIIAHSRNDLTHDRYILTNFHLINSGRGFGVIDSRGVKENAQGDIRSTFFGIEFLTSSTSVKHQFSHILEWLKEIYSDNGGIETDYFFEIGDEFDNRLLCEY